MMSDTISFKGFFNTVVSISLIVRRNDLIPNNRVEGINTYLSESSRDTHGSDNSRVSP
jgi:hypothetical protein